MTTAHSLTWTLLLLAQHPEISHQLWAESIDHSPIRAASNSKNEPATHVGDAFIDRVIRESMRILPASAYSQRINDVAVRLGPFDLPRGTPIVFTPLVTHHLAEFYPEPERFDPDRWLTARPNAYEYIPFGGGPRLCIGGPLAMEILRTTLPRIARHCSFVLEPGTEINAEVHGTMLNPAGPVPMQIGPPGDGCTTQEVRGNVNELCEFPAHDSKNLRRTPR